MQTLQDMILILFNFWQKQDCIIHQGYDLEVGAGTFNPATFLRSLGPEPYRAAYVEPSRRPQDGRYGIHPNRLQNYHQFQVLLKPVPKNFQDLFLESLQYIGLDLKEHDIRFVHDDWENPTIGASGLGWEVWLNGMEITQLTYFQTVGSQLLSVISGEITYGLERIAMYLQKKESVFDIMWTNELTYGDLVRSSEFEWSQYNFEKADVDMWLRLFRDFSKEAVTLLDANLPLPAYDFVIKASHAFNILDARGIISITERTGYISRIRQLAKEVAEKYIISRKDKGFPLMKNHENVNSSQTDRTPHVRLNEICDLKTKDDFLLEIGSEELPASFVPKGMSSLKILIEKMLHEECFEFEQVRVFGSPRRISCLISQLANRSQPRTTVKKGPLLSHIFEENGTVTISGKKFFKSIDMQLSSAEEILHHSNLKVQDIKGVKYLFVHSQNICRSIQEVFLKQIPEIIKNMTFPKKMRWDESGFEYARPIRWMVALYGKEVIPIAVPKITASNISKGHRQLHPHECIISSASTYLKELERSFVIADQNTRHQMISDELDTIRLNEGLCSEFKDRLINETTYLSEYPFVMLGSFPEDFTSLPKELLVAEMVEHQKYFPLSDHTGKLTNRFAVVIDNHPGSVIIQGNERALRPRLTDGSFLFKQDLGVPLEKFLEKLCFVRFMDNFGSLMDKTERIKENAKNLFQYCPICNKTELVEAASLCKRDLVSAVVNEFPELQGIMGSYYALASGFSYRVALAVKEHLSHIHPGDPISQTGALLSIADRIDNIIACFSNNLKPSSSNDPYALRRQALEILTLILERKLDFNFSVFLGFCIDRFFKHFNDQLPTEVIHNPASLQTEILSFINVRFRTILQNLGYKDEISSIVSRLKEFNYYQCLDTFVELRTIKNTQPLSFAQIAKVYKRVKKLLLKDIKIENGTEADYTCMSVAEKEQLNIIDKDIFFNDSITLNEKFDRLAVLSQKLDKFLNEFKIFDNNIDCEIARLRILHKCLKCFENICDFDCF